MIPVSAAAEKNTRNAAVHERQLLADSTSEPQYHMNLRDLKYILSVAETRHFGKAAARCFVSQPTLSGQIKKLEEELGVTIFERTKRWVELTPIGAEIVKHARKMMEQADAIEHLARSHHDPLAGPLRIGAIPTLSPLSHASDSCAAEDALSPTQASAN